MWRGLGRWFRTPFCSLPAELPTLRTRSEVTIPAAADRRSYLWNLFPHGRPPTHQRATPLEHRGRGGRVFEGAIRTLPQVRVRPPQHRSRQVPGMRGVAGTDCGDAPASVRLAHSLNDAGVFFGRRRGLLARSHRHDNRTAIRSRTGAAMAGTRGRNLRNRQCHISVVHVPLQAPIDGAHHKPSARVCVGGVGRPHPRVWFVCLSDVVVVIGARPWVAGGARRATGPRPPRCRWEGAV